MSIKTKPAPPSQVDGEYDPRSRAAIAARLHSVRLKARLMQREMADIVGARFTTYKQWEAGRFALPAFVYFELEEALQINPTWLHTGEGPRQRHSLEASIPVAA